MYLPVICVDAQGLRGNEDVQHRDDEIRILSEGEMRYR